MNVVMIVDKTAVTDYEILKKVFDIGLKYLIHEFTRLFFSIHDTYCEFRS